MNDNASIQFFHEYGILPNSVECPLSVVTLTCGNVERLCLVLFVHCCMVTSTCGNEERLSYSLCPKECVLSLLLTARIPFWREHILLYRKYSCLLILFLTSHGITGLWFKTLI